MQVSSNIVRFPHTPVPPVERVQQKENVEDNVVAFTPPPPPEDLGGFDAREHGMLFAAQRIASRLADDLERTATL